VWPFFIVVPEERPQADSRFQWRLIFLQIDKATVHPDVGGVRTPDLVRPRESRFLKNTCIAAHCEEYSSQCSKTIRTDRSRTSGEYLLFVFMRSILSRNGVSGNPGAVQRASGKTGAVHSFEYPRMKSIVFRYFRFISGNCSLSSICDKVFRQESLPVAGLGNSHTKRFSG